MKSFYKILVATLAFGLSVSCTDQLEQTNPNKATESTFWQSESDFNEALVSCYTPLKNALNGGYYGTRGVMLRIGRSDEVAFRNDISDIYSASRFTNTTTNTYVQGMFYQFYNALYRTNTILEKLQEKSSILSADFIKSAKGECLFIRGFYLFQLGKEFKDAPLKTVASQSAATFQQAKSSQHDIWEQAVTDLSSAAEILPTTNSVGKPTKGAALAALGKIYLYEKEWQKCYDTLLTLTKSPYTYKLVSDYKNNFNEAGENNEESIFELLIEDIGGSDIWGDGENIQSTQSNTRPKEYAAPEVGGWYEATCTQQQMNTFLKETDKDGNTDYRARASVAWNYDGCMYYLQKFQTVFAKNQSNLSKYWILKYQNWDTQTSEPDICKSFINERAIRYADVILMLAEAQMNLGNYPDAANYLNKIRERANLKDYSGALTKEGIFADLEQQRAVEFWDEGERFYDLRRWGLLEETLKTCDATKYANYISGKLSDGTNKYDYFPIPAKEIQTNLLCIQSEGW